MFIFMERVMHSCAGRLINIGLTTVALFGAAGEALAQTNPPSFVASPEIFKVIGEDKQYRIIEATLKPGQRSQVYASPKRGVYFLTDCALLRRQPNVDRESYDVAGHATMKDEVSSMSMENVGKSICRMVIFEPK
jgi:hypothetical protein